MNSDTKNKNVSVDDFAISFICISHFCIFEQVNHRKKRIEGQCSLSYRNQGLSICDIPGFLCRSRTCFHGEVFRCSEKRNFENKKSTCYAGNVVNLRKICKKEI